MFLINSRLDLVIATYKVPLLPKLRGHFAEFLRESYLAPLGILYLPTCVGFWYRHLLLMTVRAFLGSMTSTTSIPKYLPVTPQLKIFSLFLIALNAWTSCHNLDKSSLLRPSLPVKDGIGILTYCPSTTSFDLALGPDSPPADEPSGGNLRFSGHWILTNVFATQADILTSASSTPTYVNASTYNRTLPYRY